MRTRNTVGYVMCARFRQCESSGCAGTVRRLKCGWRQYTRTPIVCWWHSRNIETYHAFSRVGVRTSR